MIRWTCLSLVAIRPILADNQDVQIQLRRMSLFALGDDTGNNDARAQKIDKTLQKATNCLLQLRDALHETEDPTEEVKEILRGHESQISELEQINIESDRLKYKDSGISKMQKAH